MGCGRGVGGRRGQGGDRRGGGWLASLVGKVRGARAPSPTAVSKGRFLGGSSSAKTPPAPMLTQEELQAESVAAFRQAMGLADAAA